MKTSTPFFRLTFLLGLSSCSAALFDAVPEYGTPYAELEVRGLVTDEDRQPVKGIAVVYDNLNDGPDTVYTAADGRFLIEGTMFPREEMNLVFWDVDGAENGGTFQTRSVDVNMEQVADGQGLSDYGRFVGETEVVLKRVPEE